MSAGAPGRLAAGGAFVGLVVAGLAGCGSASPRAAAAVPATTAAGRQVGMLTDSGVVVRARWVPAPVGGGTAGARRAGGAELEVTFTPQRPGFHLYSVELPAAGVQGVGRPTVVLLSGSLTATGPVRVNRAAVAMREAGVSVPVPVYPDGPITLSVPARLGGDGPATVRVSYAACSATTCLPPVTRQAVPLRFTGSSSIA